MKQISFIVIISISGLFAAHHLKMQQHPAHVIRHGNHEMKQESKAAITLHHALRMQKSVSQKSSISALKFSELSQMEESDQIINNQMNEEIAIANLSFINEGQLQASDDNIQNQFNEQSVAYSFYNHAASADAEISENFYSEN